MSEPDATMLEVLHTLMLENDALRQALRIAESVRDDARAHSQRLLDEVRYLRVQLKDLLDGVPYGAYCSWCDWRHPRIGTAEECADIAREHASTCSANLYRNATMAGKRWLDQARKYPVHYHDDFDISAHDALRDAVDKAYEDD